YIISALFVVLILSLYLFTNSDEKFYTSDLFTDSTSQGKFVFVFVETKSQYMGDMYNYANQMKFQADLLDMPDRTQAAILTVYFYNPQDTLELNQGMIDTFHKKYNKSLTMLSRINYVKDGWQYIGHNDNSMTEIAKD